ncbi:fumarylacetoacetate hydrolase family protein [Deinococcus sp.]|uniref:fumarylacetoacetate hydrolase family protein n=1 Tax=Deinococcus sp. TaxID=47478 RepID=UPI003CC6384F
MRLERVKSTHGSALWTVGQGAERRALNIGLDELLSADDPAAALHRAANEAAPLDGELTPLPPLESQEVWASGVTYRRSQQARKRESGGSDFYDRVYEAARPELFFKGSSSRAVGPGDAVGIRQDAAWSVPEPELTLVLDCRGAIFGYTIGNDLSSRDIEGENPLYLPQAKTYARALGLGPCIVTADEISDPMNLQITLDITRGGSSVFRGQTSTANLNRPLAELAEYLFRSQSFPAGALLLTGTGIVPDDSFTLHAGDTVLIGIEGIGELSNPVIVV